MGKYSLTLKDEQELGRRIAKGDLQARNELVSANRGLVFKIARKYQKFHDVEDLVQEGMIGLMRAADNYDYRYNNKFGSYATWKIWECIRYVVKKGVKDSKISRDSLDDDILSEDKGDTFHEIVEDKKVNVEEDVMDNLLSYKIHNLLEKYLSPRSADIIRLRNGLTGEGILKGQEVGNRYGVTKQAINLVERTALRRLRNCEEVETLRDFF